MLKKSASTIKVLVFLDLPTPLLHLFNSLNTLQHAAIFNGVKCTKVKLLFVLYLTHPATKTCIYLQIHQ